MYTIKGMSLLNECSERSAAEVKARIDEAVSAYTQAKEAYPEVDWTKAHWTITVVKFDEEIDGENCDPFLSRYVPVNDDPWGYPCGGSLEVVVIDHWEEISTVCRSYDGTFHHYM